MLIVLNHTGQLCNRLWSIVPILAYSMEKGEYVFFFNSNTKYLSYFPNLLSYERFYFFNNVSSLFPNWIGRKIVKIFSMIFSYYTDRLSSKTCRGVFLVDGWNQRNDDAYVMKYYTKLCKIFVPNISTSREFMVKEMLSRGGVDTKVVGIHVRRGDYKSFHSGKYYYDDATYICVINHMRHLLCSEGYKSVFVIASNENICFADEKNGVFKMYDSDEITDLYMLSMCDYIIGPPSTYSEWASFIGAKPLLLLYSRKTDFTLNDFSRIVSMEKFENGKYA